MGFFDIVNIRGLIFAVLLALPHALYIRSSFYKKPVHENRAMVYISRIGRFFSFFLMSVNIGVLERGFTSALMESFLVLVLCCGSHGLSCAVGQKKQPAHRLSACRGNVAGCDRQRDLAGENAAHDRRDRFGDRRGIYYQILF